MYPYPIRYVVPSYYIILPHISSSDVSEDMTAVVAELSQLLEEAEQVSLEQQQRQQEMQPQAVSEVVAMENEAARPAVRMSSCILRCGVRACLLSVCYTKKPIQQIFHCLSFRPLVPVIIIECILHFVIYNLLAKQLIILSTIITII